MTNIFATFAVTPVLVFGVDRVVRRAEDLRLRPREVAAMDELTFEVAGCVGSLAALGTIDMLLPGFIAKAMAGFPDKSQVSDENARYLSALMAAEALARSDEIEQRLSTIGLADLAKIMHSAGQRRAELRARLVEAGSAVPPELYVRVVKLLRGLQRVEGDADLAGYIVSESIDMSRPAGVALRTAFIGQYLAAITDAARIYCDQSLGRPPY